MGMMKAPETCFITGFPTKNLMGGADFIEYQVNIFSKEYYMMFPWDHQNSKFVEEHRFILLGLFANNKFPIPDGKPYYNNEVLENIIKTSVYPTNPKDKLDNLLIHLGKMQTSDGSFISIPEFSTLDFFINKLYFKNFDEYIFYMRTLKDMNYITFIDNTTKTNINFGNIQITFSGLSYLIEIQNQGKNSTNCFIAMSFSDQTEEIRTAIKNACVATGYRPILIDEINVDSDETVNDAIISQIRMSKFLIADFTEQKHGVYFESGYALGHGIPVIYTCHEGDFKSSHFDTNHYPHILYSDTSKLEKFLVDKINAWID